MVSIAIGDGMILHFYESSLQRELGYIVYINSFYARVRLNNNLSGLARLRKVGVVGGSN